MLVENIDSLLVHSLLRDAYFIYSFDKGFLVTVLVHN